MSWQKQMDRELNRILQSGQLNRAPATISLATPHGHLECELTTVDTVGCAFTRLVLHSGGLKDASLDNLRQLGETLGKRLRYLLEPVESLELDVERLTLQLRSSPPQRDQERCSYYELIAGRGGSIELCRYEKVPGEPRRVIPAAVTREVLTKLAADLDQTAASL